MEKFVFLAPGVWRPQTEGRKRFVDDLHASLIESGAVVEILNGAPFKYPLFSILKSLLDLLLFGKKFQGYKLIIFPFGTFLGGRGVVNLAFIRMAKILGNCFGLASVPIFYSSVGLNLTRIFNKFGPSMAVGVEGDGVTSIPLGVNKIPSRWSPRNNSVKRILFICGYQDENKNSFDKLLYERGLWDVIKIGDFLSHMNMNLTIAAPFLCNHDLRKQLSDFIHEKSSKLKFEIISHVDTSVIFGDFDLFVFPYQIDHEIFIPTSLLEAKLAGIPTVASKLSMYDSISMDKEHQFPCSYACGNTQDLMNVISSVSDSYPAVVAESLSFADDLLEIWNMENAKNVLLGFFRN